LWTFEAFDNNIGEISSEDLTPMVRDNYTAMLLVCEPKTGKPQEFYSVNGSLGGKLSVSDTGNLIWDVESITSTFFSPATSSFTIGGTSYVFRYAFDTSGLLISQEKTNEVVNFRRKNSSKENMPRVGFFSRAAFLLAIQRLILSHSFQICFVIAVAYQLGVCYRGIVDQIVQFRPLIHIVDKQNIQTNHYLQK
jgi:hypothetical protein